MFKQFAFLIALSLAAVTSAADKVRIQLDWVPEPEFGGIYQAKMDGSFAKHQLDVEITPGGAGAATWQLVASGKVDFAVASADEVLIARQQKADVVALFATYQTCPQGIMVHAARKLKSLNDLFFDGGKLAVEPGLAYVKFLQQKFAPSNLQLVSYDGGIGGFLHDQMLAQQCFVTSEPIAAKAAGSDPQVFLIADAGYNPYTSVIITRGELARDHPDTIRAVVQSLQEGWKHYLSDSTAANETMSKLNADMDPATFALAAAAQKPLIETDETNAHELGYMSLERWTQLGKQLVDLKVIETAPNPRECFIEQK